MVRNQKKKLNEKYMGLDFFRKTGASINEHAICSILQAHPHPNIVKIYRITDSYVDIEEVNNNLRLGVLEKEAVVKAMTEAKKHLQSLGIMYIDWKYDNLGLGADGQYKLFDFDASGITKADKKTWASKPMPYWTYRQALANGIQDPIQIDDFAFDINFINTNYKPLNDTNF
jgi:serine/threonine protein kinase